jgi:hypothetical protein
MRDDDDEKQTDSHHDLAHELAERLLSCIDAFAAEKGKTSSLPVILLATEIPASVSRRLCRDAGMLKDGVRSLQAQASQCAMAYYDERAKLPMPKAEKLDVEGAFVIHPDDEYQH